MQKKIKGGPLCGDGGELQIGVGGCSRPVCLSLAPLERWPDAPKSMKRHLTQGLLSLRSACVDGLSHVGHTCIDGLQSRDEWGKKNKACVGAAS